MKRTVLKKDFFEQPTLVVAKYLLGKFLVQKTKEGELVSMITEVEAYDGPDDKASHASKGKTTRTKIMFGEAGVWYVYLVYGMHNMLNIVTGPKEYPAAVLIRGLRSISGPGRITKALHISRDLNGKRANKKNGLWIEDRGCVIQKKDILCTPRIGVSYAQEWVEKPYRFVISYCKNSNPQ